MGFSVSGLHAISMSKCRAFEGRIEFAQAARFLRENSQRKEPSFAVVRPSPFDLLSALQAQEFATSSHVENSGLAPGFREAIAPPHSSTGAPGSHGAEDYLFPMVGAETLH
jgi:hypothetical protein